MWRGNLPDRFDYAIDLCVSIPTHNGKRTTVRSNRW
jgi:hypothetical protein